MISMYERTAQETALDPIFVAREGMSNWLLPHPSSWLPERKYESGGRLWPAELVTLWERPRLDISPSGGIRYLPSSR